MPLTGVNDTVTSSDCRTEQKSIVVLWNEASGWSDDEKQSNRVHEVLSRGDLPVQFERISKGHDISGKCVQFIRNGSSVLVAAGGDGTINAVASALIHTDASLGVIPAGTLNHFARDLSIPLAADEAAFALLGGKEAAVDVGSVNGRIFLNNSVLGLYPVYRAAREAYERKGLGVNRLSRFIAVLRAIARVLWHVPKLRLRITMEDGHSLSVKTAFVLIANNEHEVEHWNLGHRTYLNKGELWVYILKRSSRRNLMTFFLRFLFRRFSRHDAFQIFSARSIRIDSRTKHLKVGLDGEIARLETPLEYRSLPRALRVIVPASYNSDTAAAKV